MRLLVTGGLAAALIAGGLMVSAPQADAGCIDAGLIMNPTALKCDDGIQPSGAWQRCVVYYAPPGDPDAQTDCHWMGPNVQHIVHQFYDPPTHID